jgi:hypothetical protein
LVNASAGLNLALDYLPSAIAFDPLVQGPDADLASRIVWFDAYVSNVDRTARNTNMLLWHRTLWLIDHGATLYMHHSPGWSREPQRAHDPFARVREHVLLRAATRLAEVDEELTARLTPDVIEGIVSAIPDTWIEDGDGRGADETRAAYARYLRERLVGPRAFVREAIDAR